MPRRVMAVLKATPGPTFYYEGIPNKETGGCILGNSVLDASLFGSHHQGFIAIGIWKMVGSFT